MDYMFLLGKAQNDIDAVDFAAIRAAYVQTDNYAPYAMPVDKTELKLAMEREEWAEAGLLCAQLLQDDYLQIELHLIMAHLFTQVEESDRAAWHRMFAHKLTEAVLATGDGRSFETAWEIVHMREMYDVLTLLKLRPLNHALVEHDEQRFEVAEVVDQAGNAMGSCYFSVEIMQRHVEQSAG